MTVKQQDSAPTLTFVTSNPSACICHLLEVLFVWYSTVSHSRNVDCRMKLKQTYSNLLVTSYVLQIQKIIIGMYTFWQVNLFCAYSLTGALNLWFICQLNLWKENKIYPHIYTPTHVCMELNNFPWNPPHPIKNMTKMQN